MEDKEKKYLDEVGLVQVFKLLRSELSKLAWTSKKVTTLNNLPVDANLIIANLTTDSEVVLSEVPESGTEIKVIVNNTGTSEITVSYNNDETIAFKLKPNERYLMQIVTDGEDVYIL